MLFSLFLCSIDNSNRYIIDSDIFIDSCLFSNIQNAQNGGALFCWNNLVVLRVHQCQFENCRGSSGGSMYFNCKSVNIEFCLLFQCSSSGEVGGFRSVTSKSSNVTCVSLSRCTSGSYRLIWWVCEEDNSIKYHNHSYSNTPGDEITTGSGSSPMNYHYILMDSCSNPSCGGILYFMSGRISLEYLTVINCIFGTGEGLILLAGGSQTIARYAFVKNCTSSYYIKYYTGGGTITFYNSIIYENQYLTVSKYNILTVGTPYFEMKCGSKIDFHSPSNIARFPRLIMYFITFITSNL